MGRGMSFSHAVLFPFNLMKPINRFLLDNGLRIADNPCVSPDFCLDWEGLQTDLASGETITHHDKSLVVTSHGEWSLAENRHGDHAWQLVPAEDSTSVLEDLMEDEGITGMSGGSDEMEDTFRFRKFVEPAGNR